MHLRSRLPLLLLGLILLPAALSAQDLPPPRPVKKSPPPETGGTAATSRDKGTAKGTKGDGGEKTTGGQVSVLFRSDENCRLTIDDETTLDLAGGEGKKLPLSPGQHLVTARAADGTRSWEETVEVKGGGQMVVRIDFRASPSVFLTPEEFDRRAGEMAVAFADLEKAAEALDLRLKKSFGFLDATLSTNLYVAQQEIRRRLEDPRFLESRDPKRRSAADDIRRAQKSADLFVELSAKALVAAQNKNGWQGEPNDLYSQAIARLPSVRWNSETFSLLGGSAAFLAGLPADVKRRFRFPLAAGEFDLGAESLSAEPRRVLLVRPKSAAAEAGLEPGDLLTKVGGEAAISLDDLARRLAKPGAVVEITVEREGKPKSLRVRGGAPPRP